MVAGSPCHYGARRGACPLGRLPTPPLACFLAPIPPTPFPSGEGGDYKLILPGAPPPAPRHQTVYGTDSPCRCSTPEGGLPSWLPAAPAFSLLFCPLYRRGRIDSPAPIPLPALAERSSRRAGGDYKLILPGASPPAPRHQTAYGTDSPCRCGTPAGGLRLGRRLALPPLHPAEWGKQSGDPEDPPRGGSAAGCRQIVAC